MEACSSSIHENSINDVDSVISSIERNVDDLKENTLMCRSDCEHQHNVHLYVSSHIEQKPFPNVLLVATHDIPPATRIFMDRPPLVYPSFFSPCLQDYVYKFLDVRLGNIPKYWTCACCLISLGSIVPVWCSKCDLPLCAKCGQPDQHEKLDTICVQAQEVGIRGRRFQSLGDVYLDISITRYIAAELYDESFANNMKFMLRNPLFQNIFSKMDQSVVNRKVNENTLPITFSMTCDLGLIRRGIMILICFGNSFYPSHNIGVFHPVLTTLVPSCFPNIEVLMNGPALEIWTTKLISKGEYFFLDFIQLPLLPTVYRQRLYKSRWGTGCTCPRCDDPTEFCTFLECINCSVCRAGFLSPMFVKITDSERIILDEDNVNCVCIDPDNLLHCCKF